MVQQRRALWALLMLVDTSLAWTMMKPLGLRTMYLASSATADHDAQTSGITLDGVDIRQDITAVNNILVVRVKETLMATGGGILLPDQSKERPTEGLVLAAGPGKLHPHTGTRIENPITAGMSVL